MKKVVILFGAAILINSVVIANHMNIKSISLDDRLSGNAFSIKNTEDSDGNLSISDNIDFTVAAEMTVHAVVHVKTKTQNNMAGDPFFELFWGRTELQPLIGTGSGVIISDDGYIVTNNHVVARADEIEIVLNDKRTYTAEVIGTDPTTDLALLKINETKLPYITYGNSDQVKIGEWVLAVGNPFNLTSTVTAGIVSAKGRNINILGGGTAIESFIQTDAAVNPGNSGGALVNTKGELIGINAAIASKTGSYTGYSFAIPVSIVKKVVSDLLEFGEVQRAYLGVSIKDIDSKLATEKRLNAMEGVYVDAVSENGAGEEAGLKAGDVITQITGVKVNSAPELQEQIGRHRPGDKIDLTLKRDGKEMALSVTLKNSRGETGVVTKESNQAISLLGANLNPVSDAEKQKLGIANGLKVSDIGRGILKDAGINNGFIITKVDKKIVRSVDDLNAILQNKKGGVLFEGIYSNGVRAYYGVGIQ